MTAPRFLNLRDGGNLPRSGLGIRGFIAVACLVLAFMAITDPLGIVWAENPYCPTEAC